MKCPRCLAPCPDDAEWCECGYNFRTGEQEGPASPDAGPPPFFTLPTLLVLATLIAILIAILLPSIIFPRPRPGSQNACINNLRMIDSGKEQAALAERWGDTSPSITTIVNQYIKGNTTPVCPARGHYTYGPMNQPPSCDYSGVTTHRFGS